MTQTNCSQCNTVLNCNVNNITACWCNQLPAILPLDATATSCLCQTCTLNKINHYLEQGKIPKEPTNSEVVGIISSHIKAIHNHYGEYLGVRIARKHVGWYVNALSDCQQFRHHFCRLEEPGQQIQSLHEFFKAIKITWNEAA